MGVIVEKSVGLIKYQLIDDLYPVHSAVTGTVAISQLSGNIYSCVNSYDWLQYYNNGRYVGEMTSSNNSEDTIAAVVGTWYMPGITNWTGGTNMSGFTFDSVNKDLELNYNTSGRFLTVLTNTTRATNARWGTMEWSPVYAANGAGSIIRYNSASYGTLASNDFSTTITPTIVGASDRDYLPYFYMAYRLAEAESSTLSRFNRQETKLFISIIQPEIRLLEAGDSKDFTTNGWTVVNDVYNQWWMGTGTTYSGGGTAIYISEDSGATPSYWAGGLQISHFYKDFAFPKNLSTSPRLDFYWKGFGEYSGASAYDYGQVYFGPTTMGVPVAGAILTGATGYTIGRTYYTGRTSYSTTGTSITLGTVAALSGTTQRLLFTWRNDNSEGNQPPFCIDSLKLSYHVGKYNGW